MKRFTSKSIFLGGLVSMSAPVLAQEAPQGRDEESRAGSTEIVVTARKQNETVLDAPASITVLTSENLAAKNITKANELSGIVPGLVQTNGNGSLPATTFRGLGTNSSVPSAEPSVAYFVDGVYYSHLRDYTSPVYDLSHVELIKGTQSTLLGKNTSVGAISLVTNRPTDFLEGSIQYTHSFEMNGNRLEGFLNVPVSDRLQVRASFFANDEEGMVYNLFRDRNEPDLRDISGRLAVAWQPSDTVDIVLRYQHDDRDQLGFQWELLQDPLGIVSGWAGSFGQVLNTVPDRQNNTGSTALGVANAGPEQFEKQNTDRVNVHAEIELGDHVLTMQTAYHDWQAPRYTDLDQTAAYLFGVEEDEFTKSFTHEVRISSLGGERLDYLAGLFYYWNKWGNGYKVGGPISNTVGFPITGIADTTLRQKTEAYSAFASASYEVFDNFYVDIGGRFTHERKRGSMERDANGIIEVISLPSLPFTRLEPLNNDSFDYSAGIRYEPSPDLLLYATYSRGSKSGGYQDSVAVPELAAYSSETAFTTEIGAKWTIDGGFLALALFNTKVEDFQNNYTASIGGITRSLIGNTDIRSRGFEATGSYGLAPGLRVDGSLIYADGEYLDDFPGDGSVALEGHPLTRNPKWTGQIDLNYEGQLTDDVELFGSATFDFASEAVLQSLVTQAIAPKMEAHETLNSRLGLRFMDGFEVAVIGTNLTNEKYVTFATGISASGGAYAGSVNRGRVIALQVGYSF